MEAVRIVIVVRPDGEAFDLCACGDAGYSLSREEFARLAGPVARALAPRDPQVATGDYLGGRPPRTEVEP